MFLNSANNDLTLLAFLSKYDISGGQNMSPVCSSSPHLFCFSSNCALYILN